MELRNEAVFVGELTTIGRLTGLPRAVELRLVYLDGKFYATSSSVQNKHWCRNLIKNPAVEIKAAGKRYYCQAKEVTDEALRQRVLSVRDSSPLLERVVFEMTPQEPPESPTPGSKQKRRRR